ncbi:MAG: aminomethyl-transferring glycine dehydrogenase subunit GcvPA [Cyanobacteria bacterium REEB65]|nr:aminomethyl-transferring glycine dehydrogenase subunit GcvPA [Cyanobacteria bacterium REEB65]
MPFNYLPLTDAERSQMLQTIGATSFDDLLAPIPAELRQVDLQLPNGHSEFEVQRQMAHLAGRNQPLSAQRSFLGAGVTLRYRPAAVDHVASRSEFFTAYTPYQPEISQGTLQVIYEFQSMIAGLTGMAVANASMYDGSSATAEAALMACRITRRSRVLVSQTVHPEYREVVRTYASGPGIGVIEVAHRDGAIDLESLEGLVMDPANVDRLAGLIIQVPNFFGCLEDVRAAATLVHEAGGLLVVVADPVSLAILEAPGQYGADIVVGDGQSLGNAMSFGGPHVGFMATRQEHVRQLPGRICGMTVDSRGNRAFTLTLQAREQHIRREKAASNICTNQALNALVATLYLALLGKQGLREVANISVQRAHYLAEQIAQLPGFALPNARQRFFNEFVVRCDRPVPEVLVQLSECGIAGGVPLVRWFAESERDLLVSVTEVNSPEDLDAYVSALALCSPVTIHV